MYLHASATARAAGRVSVVKISLAGHPHCRRASRNDASKAHAATECGGSRPLRACQKAQAEMKSTPHGWVLQARVAVSPGSLEHSSPPPTAGCVILKIPVCRAKTDVAPAFSGNHAQNARAAGTSLFLASLRKVGKKKRTEPETGFRLGVEARSHRVPLPLTLFLSHNILHHGHNLHLHQPPTCATATDVIVPFAPARQGG